MKFTPLRTLALLHVLIYIPPNYVKTLVIHAALDCFCALSRLSKLAPGDIEQNISATETNCSHFLVKSNALILVHVQMP